LDVSQNTELEYLDCKYNFFSAKAINSIFEKLPLVKEDGYGEISFGGNSYGNDEYDASIAEEKGWIVEFE
jgi:hypothetical protein